MKCRRTTSLSETPRAVSPESITNNLMNPRPVLASVAVVAACMSHSLSAYAQVDLAGQWATRQHEDAPERGGGPEVGEYQGLPINDADRLRADSWSASLWTVPEHQCIPHPAD